MSLLSHLVAYRVNCGARDKRIVSHKLPRVTFFAAVSGKLAKEWCTGKTD